MGHGLFWTPPWHVHVTESLSVAWRRCWHEQSAGETPLRPQTLYLDLYLSQLCAPVLAAAAVASGVELELADPA